MIDGSSACGGVLRSHQGAWITGFTKYIGRCSVLEAELWGIASGLELAWSLDCRRLVVESNSAKALKTIARGVCNASQITLIRYISDLCNRDWTVSFTQVSHGNNGIADRLSKMALEGDFGVKLFVDPPLEVLHMLLVDVSS
ncbi:hypothetical protein V6N13_148295 [Hibiscus sabdariffa]